MSLRTTRRFRRLTVRVEVEFFDNLGLRREIATTLGAGGLFVATENPLPKGSPLKLRFRVCEGGAFHELEGRVVWAKTARDDGEYGSGMGVEFTNPAAAGVLARELEDLAPQG